MNTSTRLKEHYPVVIVGAGPVGLCLAIELGRRGVDCLIVDKGDGSNNHPRANVVSARSLEHFRRWGIDDQVTAAGLPLDYPTNVVFTTRLFDHEITRFSFPSIADARNADAALLAQHPDIALSPYYKTAVGQNHIEPVLRAHLATLPNVELRLGWELQQLDPGVAGGAPARCEFTHGNGERATVTADHVAGCDGARSMVRQLLDIGMEGKPSLGQMIGVYIRAPGLVERFGRGGAILYWTLAPKATGVFIAIDGREEWVLQRHLREGERVEDFDPRQAVIDSMGGDFPFEILSVQPWMPRQLVADRYRQGRTFVAGDAAHLLSPTGGFGMNTGIGDAVDLGWKLAAVHQGWGGETLLDSYGIERRPIGWRNAIEATDNRVHIQASSAPPPELEDNGEAGQRLRAEWAERIQHQRKHFAAIGIHLGYRYEGSPVILADGTPAPPDDPMHYVPVARPGSRAPHLWLAPGESVLDRLGPGFSLLCLGVPTAGAHAFDCAARGLNIPLTLVGLADPAVLALYERRYVLVRPDGHVAWRGDALPADPQRILATATGRSTQAQPAARQAEEASA
ncbi:FAD-dependent monooxygenase [Variovorax sp. M-6]|uniref:FAD-dependent monooxygenase n=1 Tax=Variovorax sp. M-6 TaxID=3233041 RepID=UPI003F9C4546